MDMVGTPYAPARLWALTPDGRSNFVVDETYNAAARFGFSGLQNCKLGQSGHQAFFDVGIPSALFIWLDYDNPVPPATCESIPRGTYTTEPDYHRPTDGMNNIGPQRLQTTLGVRGPVRHQPQRRQRVLPVRVPEGAGAMSPSAPP